MNAQLVGILAAIAAAQARIEGMKAHNLACEMNGSSEIYAETSFLDEAAHLSNLSIEARNAP